MQFMVEKVRVPIGNWVSKCTHCEPLSANMFIMSILLERVRKFLYIREYTNVPKMVHI